MALLRCASFRYREWAEEPTEIEITPVMPSVDGSRGAYDVRLQVGDDVFHGRYSVWSWQTGHAYMRDIAFLFLRAHHLLDAHVEMGPDPDFTNSETEWLRERLGVRKEPVRVLGGIGWLEFILATATQRRTADPLVWGQVFVATNWNGGTEPEPLFVEYIRRGFVCTPDTATQFGRDLLAECKEAERRRETLGQHDHEDYLNEHGES